MKWTMATKKRWPTILNGRSSDSQETLKHSCCRLSTGLWWWSPRLASSSTSRRTPPSTWVTAWRTCWSTGTASTTSSTSRTTPPSKPSCSEAKSWRVRRNWAPANLRIGYFSAGWMCQGTPADRCDLGTRRCSIPTRNKQLVHSETQTATQQTNLSTQVIIVEGHFYGILPNVSRSEPVFVAWCTPVAMPETRECVVQVADLTFCNPFFKSYKFPIHTSFYVPISPPFLCCLCAHMWFCRARLIYSRRSTPWT